MSHSALPKLPIIRSLGILPFPLWGVHIQSTCLLFAENLNTVKMTEKKGSLVATPLAIEIPFRWRLCYFPACAVYDTGLGDNDSEAFAQLLQHVQRPVWPSDPLQYFHWDSPGNSIIVSLIYGKFVFDMQKLAWVDSFGGFCGQQWGTSEAWSQAHTAVPRAQLWGEALRAWDQSSVFPAWAVLTLTLCSCPQSRSCFRCQDLLLGLSSEV